MNQNILKILREPFRKTIIKKVKTPDKVKYKI